MAFSYEQKVYAKIGAGIVGVTGVFLLQYHSVNFYAESFWEGNVYYGAVNSLFFEAAAVGLWSVQDKLRNFLALLCTLMVLAGPVYQISAPLIDILNSTNTKANMYTSQLETIKTELEQKQKTLTWYESIERYPQERVKLSELNDKKLLVEQKQAENAVQDASATWQAVAKILMQIIGVILTQIVVVLCVRFVSEEISRKDHKATSWGRKRHATPNKKVK